MASRTTFRNQINKILSKHTKGIFKDQYWKPIHDTFKELDKAGYEYVLTGSKYEHDENGRPIRKVWTFEIPFGTKKPFYGIITAAGAGTVEDPLDRYDVTAYVT